MKYRWLSGLIFFIPLLACHKISNSFEGKYLKPIRNEHTDKDIRVPQSVIKKIEDLYLGHLHKKNPHEGRTNTQLLLEVTREYFRIAIKLYSSQQEVLKNNVQVEFARGGGVIDLADFVTEKRGRFNVQVDLGLKEDQSLEDFRAYFISGSRKRKVGDETMGAGCGQALEVTNFFKEKILTGRQVVYNADGRYASLLMGTFVVALMDDGVLKLSTISFTDSRFSHLACDDLEGHELGS